MLDHPGHVLPIFPLNTVLFPGGLLPLRVFEARYVDMVRGCLRNAGRNSGEPPRSADDSSEEFGVCLIRKGNEVGIGPDQAEPQEIGCRARIVGWSMEELGVLQIDVLGTERFRICDLNAEPNGLLVAHVEPLQAESPASMTPRLRACSSLLESIISRLDRHAASMEGDKNGSLAERTLRIAKPYCLDDTSWVGNRLSEVLPIPLAAKQKLMELTDAIERLSAVHHFLHQQKII